ncbi:MAG: hypothetical protein NTZ55_01600 [Candidatus Roizmanbacteria bacterium]|nr:hypothetical protein [Candidatus Roizmanbacteria bacterium]
MQKNIRKIAIGLILVVVVVGASYWVQQYLRGTKASSVPVAQFALPEGATISPGNPFELILQINPNILFLRFVFCIRSNKGFSNRRSKCCKYDYPYFG